MLLGWNRLPNDEFGALDERRGLVKRFTEGMSRT